MCSYFVHGGIMEKETLEFILMLFKKRAEVAQAEYEAVENKIDELMRLKIASYLQHIQQA